MNTATILFFLSSGLFLGWSLGANDAANIFGTAVGSRMIKFTSAAVICSVFIIIGAVMSGSGAAHTLGKLGTINTLGGAFTVAFASAATVFAMTKSSLPVSTSQAIVGGIIGWNLFSGRETEPAVFTKIVGTWILCPILALTFSFILYLITRKILNKSKIHLLKLDFYTRFGLVIVGAFGSYSLGANNIANVMGVFVPSAPFKDIQFGQFLSFSGTQQLFLVGGLAIALGVFTYSKKVMLTVGSGIFKLSPITALIVILSSSLVLFLFASKGLYDWFVWVGIPPIPLVPVSSSQAVVGAVIGIGLAKGRRNVNYRMLFKISTGWVATPVITAIICFLMLYIMQNVFQVAVYK
ncbi:MAG: inorganic phosphate transporter [SAR324 cluster bacterium]|nr:inorganic phosphate transporter [SAR324 cluster bacterium]